jgi:hypothetical protein
MKVKGAANLPWSKLIIYFQWHLLSDATQKSLGFAFALIFLPIKKMEPCPTSRLLKKRQ